MDTEIVKELPTKIIDLGTFVELKGHAFRKSAILWVTNFDKNPDEMLHRGYNHAFDIEFQIGVKGRDPLKMSYYRTDYYDCNKDNTWRTFILVAQTDRYKLVNLLITDGQSRGWTPPLEVPRPHSGTQQSHQNLSI